MTKKQRERFLTEVTKLLLSYGAQQEGDEFILATKVGKLTLHPEAHKEATGPGTVFGRFDNPKAARKLTGCNPHSGKWNLHYFDGSIEGALDNLTFWLEIV